MKMFAYEVVRINNKSEARILLEYCNGGTMFDLLRSRNNEPMPERDIFRFFGQILLALRPLHENAVPVTHRDLKLENILFGSDRNVRICDFGSCVFGPVYIRDSQEKATAEEVMEFYLNIITSSIF